MTHPTTPEHSHPATSRPASSARHTVRIVAAVLATITATLALAWFITAAPARGDALCDAMRARFGPGYPCISVPTNTFTPTAPAGPTTTNPGGQSSGGPQVGIDTGPGPGVGNGTPIVPVPGAPTNAAPGTNPAPAATPTTPQIPTGTPQPGQQTGQLVPQATQQPPATTPSRPTAPSTAPAPAGTAADAQKASIPTTGDNSSDQTTQMLWLLAGAAAIIVGATSTRSDGVGRYRATATANGYPSVVAALRSWLPGGGSERARIANSQYVLINDPTSPKSYVFHENVPPGGHMSVNPDGTATIYDKNGRPVSQIAKPWAYDSLGRPQKTWYTVDGNGDLVQHIDAAPNALYPILADPLSGGEDPTTGKSITATPLANGQEAVEGEGNGTQVVGNPDPGRTPYQPNTDTDTDTMLPDREVTVDQGNGTSNVIQTDSEGNASTNNVPTQQVYTDTQNEISQQQEAARQAAEDREEAWNGRWDGDFSKEENANSAEAKAGTENNTLSAGASASHTASKYTAEGGFSSGRDGYEFTGKAEVGTGADAEAKAEAGAEGLELKLGGFAGGRAGASVTDGSPSSTQLEGGVGARLGLGAELGGGIVKQDDGGWKFKLNAGVAAGPGVDGHVSLNVNPGKLAHALNPANWW